MALEDEKMVGGDRNDGGLLPVANTGIGLV